jgi:hypothetical protein
MLGEKKRNRDIKTVCKREDFRKEKAEVIKRYYDKKL